MYFVVPSEEVDIFCKSGGELGNLIKIFDNEDDATSFAEEIASDYYYGVEVVNESSWEIL